MTKRFSWNFSFGSSQPLEFSWISQYYPIVIGWKYFFLWRNYFWILDLFIFISQPFEHVGAMWICVGNLDAEGTTLSRKKSILRGTRRGSRKIMPRTRMVDTELRVWRPVRSYTSHLPAEQKKEAEPRGFVSEGGRSACESWRLDLPNKFM